MTTPYGSRGAFLQRAERGILYRGSTTRRPAKNPSYAAINVTTQGKLTIRFPGNGGSTTLNPTICTRHVHVRERHELAKILQNHK